MFGKVKKWLGIEGVKMELTLSDEDLHDEGKLKGTLKFLSMKEETVNSIELKLIEKYSRGKKETQLTDEYIFGNVLIEKPFVVKPGSEVSVNFSMPYNMRKSEMDEIADKNFLYDNIIKLAKYFNKVKSQYRLEVKADVEGVRLDPFISQQVEFDL